MREESFFPPELTTNIPKLTLTGDKQVYIEQHKGLVAYQEDEIVLHTSIGLMKLHGAELCFASYSSTEALIHGKIDCISLCGGQRT